MSPGARVIVLVNVLGLLCACAPQRSVRVETAPGTRRPSTAVAVNADEYVVVKGDTLYGIAFRQKLDYRDLAAINNIRSPYTIYPGQRLKLGQAATAPVTKKSVPPPASTSAGVVNPIVREAPKPVVLPRTEPTPPIAPAQSPPVQPAPAAVAPVVEPPPKPAVPAPLSDGPLRWRWPTDGKVISSFLAGDPTRQGINLAGSAGDPVLAAAQGVVVYSGSGLIGYGELVIIKHDDTWLSAYGHNRKRLVAEGDTVHGGQQVAEMGRSGASRDMLHFEVRKNGRPVDPMNVLPRR
ncbi:peptidoglycan DD-metalloendopeptidase family protein [Pseudomarimonas arenosa]|uniref:Peptidoglycan DD-metalloendopeptidase family protein n=1 Tax=Pseudomarimonas arenosa TaxID=2774145 RepID=A0AAW3ZPV9_9GAMM|nr:peptidoglycan DD-metalloendopeptidase family protein [Pseudomarimonas arenosa]MBD8527524.1 peptidoglycan DD-metalloendopeptidase family protein [Pseudomarimonas arenosa]